MGVVRGRGTYEKDKNIGEGVWPPLSLPMGVHMASIGPMTSSLGFLHGRLRAQPSRRS